MTSTLATLSLLLLGVAPTPTTPWEASAPLQAPPAEVLRAAAALPPLEGIDLDLLLEEGRYVIDAEGRVTATYRLVYRPLGKEAAGRWADVSDPYSPWHQALPEVQARVISPDGTTRRLDPATLTDAPVRDDRGGEAGQRRVLRGALPPVEAGSVVEEVVRVRETAPLFEAGAVRRFYVGREGPVRAIRLVIDAPAGRPIAWKLRGGLTGAPKEQVEGGRRRLTFRWDDVPGRTRPEPLRPPDQAAPPQLVFTTGTSWTAVAGAFGALVDRALAGAALGSAAVEAVPKGAGREAAAQAVLGWVRGHVRYDGLELGESPLAPATPAETLRRGAGDAKALAALAVGLLRQVGQPAGVALVRTAADEPADLPGLGEFDHVVVVLPGATPLYLDPADPAAPAGALSPGLLGRLALVAAPGVKSAALVRLPEAAAGTDRIELVREIDLQESGWSDASERRELRGWLATDERARRRAARSADAAARDEAAVRDHFVEAQRGSVAVEGMDRAIGPVTLALAGVGSHWGVTLTDAAEAVVSPGALLDWLPAAVRPPPPKGQATPRPAGQDEDGEAADDGEEGEAESHRRGELLLPVAYGGTLRYRVVPPAGFEVDQPLPEPLDRKIGPLTFTSRFQVEKDGSVSAVHAVALARRRLTAAEVDGLREGLGALLGDQPRIHFGRRSTRLLDAGQGREALDEIRRLVALHPAEARHHAHLAQALARLGLGEPARREARRAVELEPTSSWIQRVLAQVLSADLLGRPLSPGCELDGAIAAQRRAAELDREPAVRAHLAWLLEHGEGCERFGEGARLGEAAAVLRALHLEAKVDDFEGEHLEVLLRAGQFLEAGPVLRDLPESPEKRAAALAIRAATEGVEAAVKEALTIGPAERAAAIEGAAQHLTLARRYPEAAGLLDQASGGTSRSAQLKARAATLARVVKLEALKLDPRSPATLLQRFFRALGQGGDAWKALPELKDAGAASADGMATMGAAFRRGLRRTSGLPDKVAIDVGVSLLETRSEGDPKVALRLVTAIPGAPGPFSLVVLRVGDGWRLLVQEPVAGALGGEVRRRAEAGDLAAARQLLELARREAGEAGEGRPAGLLAALAPEGRELDGAALGLAGAALEVYVAPAAVRERLEKARAAEPDARRRAALTWALAAGAVRAERPADALPLAEELLAAEPASEPAFWLAASTLIRQGRREALDRLVARRQAIRADDTVGLRALVGRAIREGDAPGAVALQRRLQTLGQVDATELNNLAWAMLFVEPVDPEALELARRAVDQSRGPGGFALHTLASVYAVRGEPAEAIQTIRQAVERGNAANQPESHDWLVVGLVAEAYGLPEDAVTAYRRVEPEPDDGLSSFTLAERRLKALGQQGKGAPPARGPTLR